MSQAVLSLVIKAIDQTRGVFGGIKSALSTLGSLATAPIKAISGIGNALGALGLAAGGVGVIKNAIVGLIGSLTSGNAEFETFAVQFRVLFQSTSKTVAEATGKAQERLAFLSKFAANTPFELPEVVRADKILLGFGLHAEDTAKKFGVSGEQILKTVGDVASGTGVSFEELSVTFGKFASGATGEAIMRFQELGIATREQMASWGLQFSKTGQLLTPAREAFTILEKHVRAKYGGMMEATSLTWDGMISNLSDWIGATKRKLTAPIFEVLKPKLAALLAFLNSEQMTAWVDRLASRIAKGVGQVLTFFERLTRAVKIGAVAFDALKGGGLSAFLDVLSSLGVFKVPPALKDLAGILDNVASKAYTVARSLGEFFVGLAKGEDIDLGDLHDMLAEGGILDIPDSMISKQRDLVAALGPLKSVFSDLAAGNFEQMFFDITAALRNVGDAFGIDVSPLVKSLGFLMEKFEAIKKLVTDLAGIFTNVFSGKIDFATGVGQALDSLKTFVLTWIDITIREWAGKFEMAKTIFTDWIAPIIPVVTAKLTEWGGQILNWITAQLPVWSAQFSLWASAFFEWVGPMIPQVIAKLGEFAIAILTWVVAQVPPLIQQFYAWALAFVDWITPMIVDLLGRLPAIIDGILSWIEVQAGPILASLGQWAIQFLLWIIPMIPGLIANLFNIGLAIIGFIVNTAGVLLGHLLKWAAAFVSWVIPMIPQLLSALGGMLVSLAGWLIGTALPQLNAKLKEWGEAFQKWVGPAAVELLVALGRLLVQVGAWIFGTALPAIVQRLKEWAEAFVDWVRDAVTKLPGKLAEILASISRWISGAVGTVTSEALKIGTAIINGIKTGISNAVGGLISSARGAVSDAIGAAKSLLGISSPSKVFMVIGKQMTQGMAVGMRDESPTLRLASAFAARNAVREARAVRPAPQAPTSVTHNWTLEQNNYGPTPSPIRSLAALKAWAGS